MNRNDDQSLQFEIDSMLESHNKNHYEISRDSALSIIKKFPKHILSWKILSIAYFQTGQTDKAIDTMQKVAILDPLDPEIHNNLGVILFEKQELVDAEKNYKKAIELKPDYAEAYSNLANVYKQSGKLDEAKKSFIKAIELKPDYINAHCKLGIILQGLGELDEAEKSYKKAIELKPDYIEAYSNLDLVVRQKKLLLKISHANKINKKDTDSRINSKPFISIRKVEEELIARIYEMSSTELKDVNNLYENKDGRFGNGRCSDFKLFEDDSSIIKTIQKDLIKIMSQAVKSDIYIIDSFFNIYNEGSGSVPHGHIDFFDKTYKLEKQKHSLTYYLSVGDQNCTEPGILKLYDPDEDILPSEGTIVIMPASRRHSAVYNGKIDRVMIGINFYSLL